MKRVEEFQETEKLIEEYKNFGNKISEYEGKIDSNKEENAAKVNELEGQLEINNKKSAERIKKLESQLQITFSDAEFEIDRAALQDEVNKQIELEKANLAKENKEIEKTIKAEKANLVAENKKVENQIKAEKDNKKYFRTDANLKTITMEIEEMKKEVAKCKLELAKKDLELREFYAEGASQENKSKWQEIYKEQDEIKNNMNELNSKIDEYQNFKNELLSITLTPSEYKEMYAREERKDPAKAEEERKEKLWDEINQSIEQNIEGGKEETKSPTIDNSAEKKAQSEHKENGESEPDIVDEVNESIENNMKKPETKWEDISSNSTPAVEANKYCLHIERNRKNIVVNGVEFSREEVAKKREAIEMYMQNFEVLATDKFKEKQIKKEQRVSVGVKIENNLIDIDLSNLNFDTKELQEIMRKYKLKRKFHRLKDGSFINLEENENIEFIQNITKDIDIDYSKIKDNSIKLPIYRSFYLEKVLEKNEFINANRDSSYKEFVGGLTKTKVELNKPMSKYLKASLREYQIIGFNWLTALDEYGIGGILADDMGLGKTIQILSVIATYIENNNNPKQTLIVCPSSLSLNWQSEINKFTSGISSLVIHGTLEERQKQIKEILDYNVIITSYELLKRDIEEYKKYNYEFKYIVADEAQYIKNNNTQNAKTIKEIKAETKYALTGTPIENSLAELWSIFDFIMPGYLFSYKKFKELYETPIIKDNDQEAMKKLKRLINPFVLRRIKKEVLTELPDKTVTVLNSQMTEEQKEIYMAYLARAKKNVEDEIKENGIEKSQIKILALLTRLRQICCHPSLFIDKYKGESGKLNQCLEILRDAINSDHKTLLFSGYTSMFDIIEKELKNQNIKYLKLTGQTKVSERMDLVDEFNKNDEIKVFLISLKAGGTGLNLTSADMVIHYDPWWNLSAENQATDRTYRIGQKRNVQVYKLITKDSIEEKIYELQKRKETLIDTMLSTKQTFINKLSKEEILSLFE